MATPMKTTDISPMLKRLREMARLPERAAEALVIVTPQQVEALAKARASRLRRKDGSVSQLGNAILRRNSVDKLYRWQPRGRIGVELQMSAWARKATGPMFTLYPSDRIKLKQAMIKQLKRRR